jgi:hypothetical protein
MPDKRQPKKDLFAAIAVRDDSDPQPISLRQEALTEPLPPDLTPRNLPVTPHDPQAAFTPAPKLDDAQKLQAELERQRAIYAPFLRNLAPAPEQTRITVPLDEFDWRLQTDADLADFGATLRGAGAWQQVRIPHYGGPLGRATAYYRTTFTVTEEMRSLGALFVCFKGVDYRAHVFVNGTYLGSHEGFFAPFEFDFTRVARIGENVLLVQVENDAICMGNESWGENGELYEGDKIYAATGPGYDDPVDGWHHCPPGMGIYQDVSIEARAPIHIHDIFVRPNLAAASAEAWIEVYSCHTLRHDISIELSLFGQNFEETVFQDERYELAGPAGPTLNYYRLPFEIPNPRVWEQDTPWLYQLQVRLLDEHDQTLDIATRQFGMRSFHMDEEHEPKGRFYLNGQEIRLRGANTMGHMQQCVIKKDWDQLRDDILLMKICHLNFFRLTQRPVQSEIYDYCDRLGMLTQTDLPLFGVLRRNQFAEAVRQAGEMERLVRSHPCNIMVTYINEPFPEGHGSLHRQLSREEMESFFTAANQAVLLANPDRVIKPVDGDYDPPGPSLPDNHCYCGWYNGHGVDLGKLHKGFWQKVKPGWCYGCGEFGAEGLDPVEVMYKYYPKDWLPASPTEQSDWTPDSILKAQTGRFHYLWFDTQHTLADWVEASRNHQAWVTRLMTEAFRRDSHMVSFAIHLSIDAFPSGWMKTIMDVDRQPKPAYFAYREALTPLMANLRTDRFAYFAGEEMQLEAWVCNDLPTAPSAATLHYQLEMGGQVLLAQRAPATVPVSGSAFQGYLPFTAPNVQARTPVTVRLALLDEQGQVLHDTSLTLDVFPKLAVTKSPTAVVLGAVGGPASQLANELQLPLSPLADLQRASLILIDDPAQFAAHAHAITTAVEQGAIAVLLELPVGEFALADSTITIERAGMNPRHFVSRQTGHPLVAGFQPNDFRFWHDSRTGYVTPILHTTFSAKGWDAILTSGNGDWSSGWGPALAVAEQRLGKGAFRICQLSLAGRTTTNPVARLFAQRLLGLLS